MRWGWKPHSGTDPVINVRAETADLGQNRCLVPATEFILFTGAEPPKRRWRATLKGEQLFFLAALWREATADWPRSYTIITIDAASDLATITDRQLAVIRSSDAGLWLAGSDGAAGLLKPLPSGSFEVEEQASS